MSNDYKNTSFVGDWCLNKKMLRFLSVRQIVLLLKQSSTKLLSFQFFFCLLWEQHMQKRILEEAPSHVPYRSCCVHFFDAAEKSTSEQRCIRYLYTRGSENPPEKIEKKWKRVPEGSHSRPPGRSKSMVFKRISSGGGSPSDAWPGPPRCSLCLLLMHGNHHT